MQDRLDWLKLYDPVHALKIDKPKIEKNKINKCGTRCVYVWKFNKIFFCLSLAKLFEPK